MIDKLREQKYRADKLLLSYEEDNSELEVDEEFYHLENEVNQLENYPLNDSELRIYAATKKILIRIRKDFDLYDEDNERNAMFPEGEDD